MPITSKYPGTCRACGATLPAGTPVNYRKGAGITCATCPPPKVGNHGAGTRPPGYWASRRDPNGLYTPDGRCIARVRCNCEDYPCCGH